MTKTGRRCKGFHQECVPPPSLSICLCRYGGSRAIALNHQARAGTTSSWATRCNRIKCPINHLTSFMFYVRSFTMNETLIYEMKNKKRNEFFMVFHTIFRIHHHIQYRREPNMNENVRRLPTYTRDRFGISLHVVTTCASASACESRTRNPFA